MQPIDQLNAALADRYVVERLIGEGGMATVYLARDVRHNRHVALKVLKPDLGAIVGVERFLSEIEVTANLQHPNLLPLFDSGEANGLLFYVMPYIEGESVRARLVREKQLSVEDAVHIATLVASALDYAHRHGVIHRDLKPENILLHDGQPLVADFGIALALSNAGGNRITQTGLSLGTPQYMSPEQATGDRVIDARTDIYSLGAVTYEMLTGDAPHTGSTSQAIIARLLTEKPRSIRATRPNVPPHVEAAIEHALEKLAPDRFATAKEFSEALTGARAVAVYTSSSPARTAVTAVVEPRGARRREAVAWSLAGVGIVAAALFAVKANRPPPPPLAPAEFAIALPDSLGVSSERNAAVVALSPDGSTMAFQGRRGRGSQQAIYSRRLDDRSVQVIRGTEDGGRPIFKPDGSEILFLQQGVMKRASVQGGTPHIVADSALTYSWGENHQIVFSTRSGGLYVVSEDGGTARLLAQPDSARHLVSYSWPWILPGGKAALITIRTGDDLLDSARLGMVSLEDGRVTEFSPTVRGTNPQYSPTGHVMYATADGILLALPFDVRSARVTGAPQRVAEGVTVGNGGAAAFAVARGGTIALWRSGVAGGGRELVRVTRGGVATSLSPHTGYFQAPRVSPDGHQVALTVYAGGGRPFQTSPDPDIWRLDLGSGGTLERVTTDSASLGPEWSADGDRIAYVTNPPTVALSRSVFSSGAPTTLARGPVGIVAVGLGMPHGHVALTVSRSFRDPPNIYVAAVDSLVAPKPLITEPYGEGDARFSAGERLIAYASDRTGSREVYVRSFSGNQEQLQVSNGGGIEPIWSRDGNELFYRVPGYLMSARIEQGTHLRVARRDTLFRDTYLATGRTSDYDVFPDGKSFVMLRNIASTNADSLGPPIVVMMNWRPGRPGTGFER